jgi:hypothetical protein
LTICTNKLPDSLSLSSPSSSSPSSSSSSSPSRQKDFARKWQKGGREKKKGPRKKKTPRFQFASGLILVLVRCPKQKRKRPSEPRGDRWYVYMGGKASGSIVLFYFLFWARSLLRKTPQTPRHRICLVYLSLPPAIAGVFGFLSKCRWPPSLPSWEEKNKIKTHRLLFRRIATRPLILDRFPCVFRVHAPLSPNTLPPGITH